MTNPTHKEIIDAYDALDTLCDRVPATRSAKERILKALPPKPQSTILAEIEWNEDEHYLAEAKYLHRGRVIMLTPTGESGIKCFRKSNGYTFTISSYFLEPTGKRYALTEV